MNKGHGRIEIRQCRVLFDPSCLAILPQRDDWHNLRLVAEVRDERRVGETTSQETRYFIGSLCATGRGAAQRVLQAVRTHWTVENQLHWVLDVAFREDDCRVRKDHSPHNLVIVRHIALNLLKNERTCKRGLKKVPSKKQTI